MKSCKRQCVLLIKWSYNILGINWSIENAISNLLKLWCKGGNAELGWIFFSIPKSNNTRGTVIEKLVRYYSLIQHEIKKLHLGPVLGPLCQNNSSNFQSLCCYKKLYAREPQRIQCIDLLQLKKLILSLILPQNTSAGFFPRKSCRRIPWTDFSKKSKKFHALIFDETWQV